MARNVTGEDRAGFSLLELMLVIGIGLLITAVGLPMMNNAISNMKLRSSMTTVSGFLQNSRMLAVKKNRTMTARNFNRNSAPFSLVYYVKEAQDSSAMTTSDSQIEMEAPITGFDTPSGPSAPPAISNSSLGLLTSPQTGDPSFNSQGIPCTYSGGTCSNVAFVKYFKDNRIGGAGGWAAISITPAGRIKRWFWNGSAWSE